MTRMMRSRLAAPTWALAGAGAALAALMGAALLIARPAQSQTQGVIVWESGTDYAKPKGKKLRAGGQGSGGKADATHKETIPIESFSWGAPAKKKPAAKRRAQ